MSGLSEQFIDQSFRTYSKEGVSQNLVRKAKQVLEDINELLAQGESDRALSYCDSIPSLFAELVKPESLETVKQLFLSYVQSELGQPNDDSTDEASLDRPMETLTIRGQEVQIPVELLDTLGVTGEEQWSIHYEDLFDKSVDEVIERKPAHNVLDRVGNLRGAELLFLVQPSKHESQSVIVRVGDRIYLGYTNTSKDMQTRRLVVLVLNQSLLNELDKKQE